MRIRIIYGLDSLWGNADTEDFDSESSVLRFEDLVKERCLNEYGRQCTIEMEQVDCQPNVAHYINGEADVDLEILVGDVWAEFEWIVVCQ